MRNLLLILLVLSSMSFARRRTPKIDNSRIAREDVVYIDGTETVYSPIFWQATGGVKSLLLQASDDSTAGFASDSACASVELMQVFDNGTGNVIVLPSRAHPDSTGWPYGADFMLYDSLDIADMDTASYWSRVALPSQNANDDTVGTYYNDSLNAVGTAPGAFSYIPIVPDYSPGLVLKFTGKANNSTDGDGSRWIVRWYQENGAPVTEK
jgi:hypothetical protein